MGFADGFYYGQGKFIVDATMLSDGDIVRIRSLTAPTKVWNKTVASGDEYLVFDVPGKDYYKISLNREISDVETEITAINKTVDYGQTLLVNVLNKNTLAGIQAILNNHSENEILNIGDEVTITVSGAPWVMLVGGIDLYADHEVIFVSKYLTEGKYATNGYNYNNSGFRSGCTTFYNSISVAEQPYIKDKMVISRSGSTTTTSNTYKVWIPTITELCIPTTTEQTTNRQFPIFATAENRAKCKIDNLAATNRYPTCSIKDTTSGSLGWHAISAGGAEAFPYNQNNVNEPILPCFHLIADI